MSWDDEAEFEMEDEYYDEEEEPEDVDEYGKLNLPWPGGPFVQPVRWYVEGILTGDIKWNNIDAQICLHIPYPETEKDKVQQIRDMYGDDANVTKRTFFVRVRPFTHNCGVKAIEDLSVSGSNEECKLFLTYLESFLWHKCNVGIIIGSDYVDGEDQGLTGRNIKTYGEGYTIEEPTWNPNYKWTNGRNHKIFLFHKQLTEANVPVNYWS